MSNAQDTGSSMVRKQPDVMTKVESVQEMSVQQEDNKEGEDDKEERIELQKNLAHETLPTGVLKVGHDGSSFAAPAKSSMMKKPLTATARKIPTVAKKIVSKNPSSSDVVLESFEATDRRLALAAKQSETVAAPTSQSSHKVSESSRLAAAYSDSLMTEPEGPSIYRSAPTVAAVSSTKSGAFSSSANTGSSTAGESYVAREKYGNAKGISSDQFFGDPVAEARDREARMKLDRLAGSTSISSDMLRGESGDDRDSWSNINSPALDVTSLGRWTQDLIKRIG
jgi:hypothetical protein